MITLLINLILSVLVFNLGIVLVLTWKWKRLQKAREDSIWNYLAEAVEQNPKMDPRSIGIELQWVALERVGLDRDATLRSLKIQDRVRVQAEIDALVLVGHRLVQKGLLRYLLWAPPDRVIENKIEPPNSLLCVDDKGVLVVQKAMARRATCLAAAAS